MSQGRKASHCLVAPDLERPPRLTMPSAAALAKNAKFLQYDAQAQRRSSFMPTSPTSPYSPPAVPPSTSLAPLSPPPWSPSPTQPPPGDGSRWSGMYEKKQVDYEPDPVGPAALDRSLSARTTTSVASSTSSSSEDNGGLEETAWSPGGRPIPVTLPLDIRRASLSASTQPTDEKLHIEERAQESAPESQPDRPQLGPIVLPPPPHREVIPLLSYVPPSRFLIPPKPGSWEPSKGSAGGAGRRRSILGKKPAKDQTLKFMSVLTWNVWFDGLHLTSTLR